VNSSLDRTHSSLGLPDIRSLKQVQSLTLVILILNQLTLEGRKGEDAVQVHGASFRLEGNHLPYMEAQSR